MNLKTMVMKIFSLKNIRIRTKEFFSRFSTKTLSDILVIIFMVFMIPSMLIGSYRMFIDSYDKLTDQKISLTPEQIDSIQLILDNLYENMDYRRKASFYEIQFIENTQSGEMDQFASIICISGDPKSSLSIRYWDYERVPKGYRHYNSKLLDEKEVYIPSIKENEKIYVDRTAEYLRMDNTQSIYGLFICDGYYEGQKYFLGVSFQFENPHEEIKFFRYRSRNASKQIKKILKP